MTSIQDLRKKYHRLIAPLDLELLFSFVLKKPREFVLAHPEHDIPATHNLKLTTLFKKRIAGEPIAYLIGQKEFYGLEFKVNKNTLIPRPETELLVDLALEEVRKLVSKRLRTNINVVDVGTGSGNIIISLAYNMRYETYNNITLYGTDISPKALAIAKQNANTHRLDKKIKFLHGNLLDPILKNKKYFIHSAKYIILANLPYLSSQIYASAPKDVRLYEPKGALYSPQSGLEHYLKLLKQLAGLSRDHSVSHIACYMEISPEQKPLLCKIIPQILPSAKITFHKDLAQKWRVCQIEI